MAGSRVARCSFGPVATGSIRRNRASPYPFLGRCSVDRETSNYMSLSGKRSEQQGPQPRRRALSPATAKSPSQWHIELRDATNDNQYYIVIVVRLFKKERKKRFSL